MTGFANKVNFIIAPILVIFIQQKDKWRKGQPIACAEKNEGSGYWGVDTSKKKREGRIMGNNGANYY